MCQKILKIAVYLLIFLTPLFWTSLSFEAFDFNKIYLIFFLSSIAFLTWIARMVFEDKKANFKKNPLDIFVLVYLVVLILNLIFSVDKTTSVFGFYGRFWPNVLGIFSLAALYFVVSNNTKPLNRKQEEPSADIPVEGGGEKGEKEEGGEKKRKKENLLTIEGMVKSFLWSAFFVTAIAYLSIFGFWKTVAAELNLPNIVKSKGFNPAAGTLEQLAVFLSVVFTLLVLRLAFKGFRSEKEKPSLWSYLFLFSIFVLLIIINFWVTWLIILVSLLLFLAFSFWKRFFREDVNRLSLSILFAIVSLIFLFSNPLQDLISQTGVLSDIPQEVRLSQGTSWKVSASGLKENPLLGSGAGTYNYVFSKHKPQDFLETSFWNLRFDRAGNHISEIIATRGALGVISYGALIVMFFLISWVVISGNPPVKMTKIQIPLMSAFFAVVVAQFVFYQNAVLGFAFWLLLALGSIGWGRPQKEKGVEFKDFPEIGLVISIIFWVILIALSILYFAMIKYYVADVYYKDFLISPLNNIPKMEKSVELNRGRADYHMALARGYLWKMSEEAQKENPDTAALTRWVSGSIKEGRIAAEIAPRRSATQETLGIVYREVQGLAQGALQWGIKTFRSALESEPKNPILLTELGRLLVADDKPDQARELFEQAIALKEDYASAAVELSRLAQQNENMEEALNRMEEVVQKNPFSTLAHFELGRLYFNKGKHEKARAQFESVITLFPNHSNALYSLGLVYEKLGRKNDALTALERVKELNPGNQQVEQKIREIKGGELPSAVEEKKTGEEPEEVPEEVKEKTEETEETGEGAE